MRLGAGQVARYGAQRFPLAEDADAVVAAAVVDRLAVVGFHARAVGQLLELVVRVPCGEFVQLLQGDHVGVYQRNDLGCVVVVGAIHVGLGLPAFAAVGVVGRQPDRIGQASVTVLVGVLGRSGRVSQIEIGVVAVELVARGEGRCRAECQQQVC